MQETTIYDEAGSEREKQRSESEARDIIHDLDRLYTCPEERKTRWVWELLQNAKDVANSGGVCIEFILTSDKLIFKHNGSPFQTKHLLALLYKTSTKSLSGEGGTTGKYGTGFVTTHILNKKIEISGVHENDTGKRRFSIEIDRSACSFDEATALTAVQKSLSETFQVISDIAKKPGENVQNNWNTFTYPLNSDTFTYAEKGIIELTKNLAFTLLINSVYGNSDNTGSFKTINEVSIETSTGKKSFVISNQETNIPNVKFASFDSEFGLLYKHQGKLIYGVPAIRQDDYFHISPLDHQAVLFKEFPLIGTENFNLPVLLQHKDFHPTELRDGIRTKVVSKDEEDPIAKKNRDALIEFVSSYKIFMLSLMEAKVKGTYLLAKSGLPEFIENYSNQDWFETNVQLPIRKFILEKKIVETTSGIFIEIEKAKFIPGDTIEKETFYSLASQLLPDQIPDKESIWEWSEIIAQDINNWPKGIILGIEDLVRFVPEMIDLKDEKSFEWLKDLYRFLDRCDAAHLGEKYPIYPNEVGTFCLRDTVAIHPEIDEEFKFVSEGLGRPLNNEFLNRKVGAVAGIKSFDLNEFYKDLNNTLINEVKIVTATEVHAKSIIRVCGLFRSDRALKREKWLDIISQLLPDLAPEKKIVFVDYENYWRSAEFWSIKYVCHLLEKAARPSVFAQNYFEGHEESCFAWLNDFLAYVFELQEDNREIILKRSIIPTQNDQFRSNEDYIYAEQDSRYFNNMIKDIYKNYTEKGDPRKCIIDTRISFENLDKKRRDVSALTREIDKLFHDNNIESKVKKGGSLNEMFLQLNDWYEEFSKPNELLPTFSNKRTSLYVLALGEGFSKQIMEIQSSGKSIEDIAELAKIQLTTNEMKLLESAASELGTDQLLAKAQEMLDAKYQIERWKTIGKAAEEAFKESLLHVEPDFEILNPDIGKDFVIVANGKEYAIEIKSVESLKGNVNMSLRQGKTAVEEKNNYSLCVLTRPDSDQSIDKDYFIKEARFVKDIGFKIGDSIDIWNQGLRNLDTNADVKVSLDDKTESIYISRTIWKSGTSISFTEFVGALKDYFAQRN